MTVCDPHSAPTERHDKALTVVCFPRTAELYPRCILPALSGPLGLFYTA